MFLCFVCQRGAGETVAAKQKVEVEKEGQVRASNNSINRLASPILSRPRGCARASNNPSG